MIDLPDNYCLIEQQLSPKENVKAVYQCACARDNFTGDEQTLKKFRRSGKWLFEYIDQLRKMEFEILDSSGMIGVIESKLDELKNLTADEALKLFFVTMALYHADVVKKDLVQALINYGPKKFGPPKKAIEQSF